MDVIFHHGTPSLGRVYAPWEQGGARDDGHLTLYEDGIPGVHDWLSRVRG